MRFLILALLLLVGPAALAQYSIRAVVRDSLTQEVLVGVSGAVRGTPNGGATDVQGQLTLDNISGPTAELVFSYLGYRVKTITVALPQTGEPLTVLLGPDSNALEEVVVTSTRTNSRIEDLPTRIEVLGAEELEEESGIKPGNVASILGDVASIQIQPTSATTGNADLRIQGLQGKYTQILRDGLPLFGGYAGSFGILQIPPLDLRQVEIIKGASSTLYGGGAIAGMINLISKEPQLSGPERTVLANLSTLRESNLNGFFSGRNERVGYTLFVGGTRQQAVDVNGDSYSDVPRLGSVLIHPRLFLYPSQQSKLVIGYTGTYERRRGGDMQVLREQPDATHQFFINNDSWRHTADARYDRTTAERGDQLVLKASLSSFQRNATTNTTGLNARQLSYYTEASQLLKLSHHDVVLGANVTGESFRPVLVQGLQLRAYDYVTPGVFAQDDWKPTPAFTLQSGLRIDHHNRYGTFVLPRLSALLKLGNHFSSRLGGGLGYKAPSFFVNELDERDFARVLPFTDANKAERSTGANWDVNYAAVAGQGEEALHITINQSFFLTQIQHPLLLNTDSRTSYITFSNADQPFLTRGFETYVRLRQNETELYLGYVFTDARRLDLPGHPRLSLIARDKLASVLSREFNEHWRAGIEAAYTGRQHRDDGPLTPGYLFMAGMVRYSTGPMSFVLNGENLLDYRQTRKETIWSGDRTNPAFRQLWAPIEGRVINLSATAKF
ncbi:TonB-dependent receptor [Hymenobacter wooponensis]|uniref:TonB-dependent receptor n=1 Tax=Hymenobacter wooponensis TaxID=1525360 RepID=A0A4Z0MV22_9BACT|nr:TonB-dependent receptor [Hymenobacter wooponensis]TGD83097.1 TonB-dependent receptor [Hymenobacter wooponensis]